MPSLGFPITVELVEEPRTLFPACHGSTVTEITAALRSNYETGRPPHPADLKATILHMAVSMSRTRNVSSTSPAAVQGVWGLTSRESSCSLGTASALRTLGAPATGQSGGVPRCWSTW
jgi:hypothetical protein